MLSLLGSVYGGPDFLAIVQVGHVREVSRTAGSGWNVSSCQQERPELLHTV